MGGGADFHIIEGSLRPLEAVVSPGPGCGVIEGPSCDRVVEGRSGPNHQHCHSLGQGWGSQETLAHL